jgi:hypothetical protein
VNSPSVLVSIRFFGMGKGMGGDISQIKRLYAAITCSNFERTLPPPKHAYLSANLLHSWLAYTKAYTTGLSMSDLASFEDAIKATAKEARSVLLGNGFSIAQAGGQFAYATLLEKSGLAEDSPVRNVFNILKTYDFEKVMKALQDAAQIELAYKDHDRSKKFGQDAGAVREALIHAVRGVHPGIQFDIPKVQRDACAVFLKYFHSIFSLNYDLLLYWVILHDAAGDFNDGFGLGEEVDGFRTFSEEAYCNTYYLHGALHLFLNEELETQKRVVTASTIIDDIATTIRHREQLPLFVAEGTAAQKIARIRSVPYLTNCFDALASITGSLFIFGHGASDNDIHIYDAICRSKIKKVFIFVYEPARNLVSTRERMARYSERRKDIEWSYLDSKSAKVWG